jgi:hypothetical protein
MAKVGNNPETKFILDDLSELKSKSEGATLKLIKLMINAVKNNPEDPVRGIERLLITKINDLDFKEENSD